jgi:predicted metalloprotease
MKWQGRQRSSNIEDRRTPTRGGGMFGGNRGVGGGGFNPFGSGGGPRIQLPSGKGGGIGGLGIIIVVVIIGMSLFGINPLSLLEGTIGQGTSTTSADSRPLPEAGQDELADFVGVVTKETENLWTEVFAQNGSTYDPPVVVLFTDQTTSDCGVAQAASGPFYCPIDRRVYIDLAFYDQLRRQFGAPGDFAQAYVIAHEIGHHVQNLTGVLPEFNARRATMSEAEVNAYSVKVELQADCYAGVWANYANQQNLLDQGDTEEAINAANAIGDDTLTRGQVSPRNFTHGTSEQRMAWLRKGMTTGDVGQCDTFAVAQP